MAEQVGKFLTELPELETPTDEDLMYIVDDETTSKKVTMANLKRVLGGNVTGTVEDASVSFSDGADGIPMEECEVTIVPTQDLHGYSKPWAGGAGKNKFNIDENRIGIDYDNSSSLSRFWQTVSLPNGNYTISFNGNMTGISEISFGKADSMLPFSSLNQHVLRSVMSSSNTSLTVTIDASYPFVFIGAIKSGGSITKADIENLQIQIETGNTATTYEPYSNICPISGHTDVTVTVASTSGGSGEDTTVSLGRTVYGGTLDLDTGVLKVTTVDGNLGTLTYNKIDVAQGTMFRASVSGIKEDSELLCEIYETTAPSDRAEGTISKTSGLNIDIIDSRYSDANTFRTAMNGVKFTYELATPQTFNLTSTQVLTLKGQNYVSHDGGGNIKVVYIRDLDITINDLINRVTALENE